jgi:hypothetical protein
MKNKLPLLIISGLMLINLLSNSCKKDNTNNIETILSAGAWQLSSVAVTYSVGDTSLVVPLNTNCDTTQVLTFNADKTCTYTNFNCKHQPTAGGHWAITANKLFLNSDIVCQDTTAAGKSTPFTNAKIDNAGQYSLVLLTGDIQNYTTTTKRKVVRYGFVRQKAVSK